jgi:tetratricopeptide (TPR) repeat protein
VKFELKKLNRDSLPAALKKAEHYRLLNEPRQAESICRDILEIDSTHRQALIMLALSLSDQFESETARKADEAKRILEQVPDEYERSYYTGLICERRATAYLQGGRAGTSGWAFDWYRQAMDWYEKAERARPQGNDDVLLRWNTCARIIMQEHLEPVQEPLVETALE